MISNKLHFKCTYEKKDSDGRFVLVRGYLQDVLVMLMNVYASPGSDWEFYKYIFELISSESQGIVICGGDFSVTSPDS